MGGQADCVQCGRNRGHQAGDQSQHEHRDRCERAGSIEDCGVFLVLRMNVSGGQQRDTD